jgi:hypothetical protein
MDNDSNTNKSPFTLKGLVIGSILALMIGLIAPYGLMMQLFLIGFNPSSPGALFFFFVLTFGVNVLLGMVKQRFALARADLILIYCMLLMAVTVPTWGLLFFLVGTMIYPYYFATTENNFAGYLHPFIREWMVPQDFQAIKDFYEGLPQGASIPWGAWIEPLGWWFALVTAFNLLLICTGAILHRQWSLHERLAYPMAQLPQQMIDKGEDPLSRIAPFFKNRVMWLGSAVPLICFSLTGLHYYFPMVPNFPFFWDTLLWFRDSVWMPFAFSFAWVGFFYLVNLEITFSIWFFYILLKVEEGIFKMLGIASTEKLSLYEYSQPADLTHQASGAVLIFVLYGLWHGRDHLKDVVGKFWRSSAGVDDSEELLRYRTAVFGFIASFLFIAAWLWRSGVPLVLLPILILISLVFYIFVARLVATTGVATARSPIVPAFFIISGFGTSVLGLQGVVALNFTFVWQGESRTSPLVACANGLKLAETVRGSKTRLFWGMMLALSLAFAGGIYMILFASYSHGATNLSGINWAGAHGWPYVGPIMEEMPAANARGWLFKAIGASLEAFLMWAQHRWFWWPLHPVGFALAVGWLAGHIWFSALVAWVFKLAIMHYGGSKLFRNLKPFFLGLILGECIVTGIWGLLYFLTGDRGHILTHM